MSTIEQQSPIIRSDFENREFLSDVSLLFISIIWGSTFNIVKQAIADIPAFAFLTLRFGLAFSLLILICFRRLKHLSLRMMLDGGLLGAALIVGAMLSAEIGTYFQIKSKRLSCGNPKE